MRIISACVFLVIFFYGCKKSNQEQPSSVHNSPDTILKSTGLIPSPLAEIQAIPFIFDADTAVIPGLAKTTGYPSWNIPVPPAGDQGVNDFGNCTAWAVGYGLLSWEFLSADGNSNYNGDDKIFSPSFIYNQLNGGKDEGIHILAALNFLKNVGCCKWRYMSGYIPSFTQQPTLEARENASKYKIATIYRFRNVDADRIKPWLVRNYVIPFGIALDSGFAYGLYPEQFPRFKNSYERRSIDGVSVPVWKQKVGGHYSNHAMLICGYNDKIRAYKVLNSWGSTWGDGEGFIWIDYDFLNSVIMKISGEIELYLAVPNITKTPELNTSSVTNISSTSSVSGGTIIKDGGSSITQRGVCWSTTANPTIANNRTNDGTGSGSFTSNLSGLSPNTTYYVKSYATNSKGTGYGNEMTFTTNNSNYNIGDTAFGGIIFYLDNSKKHGLVFDYKISNQSFYASWDGDPLWVNGSFVFRTTNATATNIGSGATNTNKIISALATPPPTNAYSANLCRNNTGSGYNDWFMPSLDELRELYKNRQLIPYAVSTTWSSSENSTDPNKAWYIDFTTGNVITDRKGFASYTIPVRLF